jgi:hypothetical protein
MNKRPDVANTLVNRALLKRIAQLLRGHVSIHIPQKNSRHLRVLERAKSAPKRSAEIDTFVVTFQAPIFTSSCGNLARSGIGNLQHAGMILLIKSLDGNALYVEVGHASKDTESIRVSTGSITDDLEKAVTRSKASMESRRTKSDIRILRISAMHLSSIWRHIPANPKADQIVPYTANFAGVRKGSAYSLRRANGILKKSAIQAILRWYEVYEKDLPQTPPSTKPAPSKRCQ